MGICCAAQPRDEKLDAKEQRLDIQKPATEEPIEENAGKTAPVDPEIEFFANAETFMSYNEDVNKIFIQRGPFSFAPYTQDNKIVRILKRLPKDDRGEYYYGFVNAETNQKDGKGVLIYEDGSRYDGNFTEDFPNGKGRTIFASGEIYEGDYYKGKLHGRGTLIRTDGSKYEGEFVEGEQHGRGTEIWPDGAKYEGQYQNGKKEGHGCFKWADESEYTGEFVDNCINGKGLYKWGDGKAYDGEWVNYKMHGKGVFVWPGGRKYIGDYVDDRKEGHGVMEWYTLYNVNRYNRPDGRRYSGSWMNGKQSGLGYYRDTKGKIVLAEWNDGKIVPGTAKFVSDFEEVPLS